MVNVIDYVPGTTLLHKLNPVAKLALAAAIILSTFLAQSYMMLIGLLALTLALGAYAGVVDRLLKLLRLLIPIALIMLVLQTAFMREGETLFAFVTDTGLITGSKACLRLLGVALPLVLMLMVTKLNDLANACVEKLHVPYRYAFTFTTALRFVPVFSQEMNAIIEAQTARGVEYDTKNPVKKLKLMLPLCAPLLISSVGKTDATALAAEQRGFYLRTRKSSYKRYPFAACDIAVLVFCVALISAGAVLSFCSPVAQTCSPCYHATGRYVIRRAYGTPQKTKEAGKRGTRSAHIRAHREGGRTRRGIWGPCAPLVFHRLHRRCLRCCASSILEGIAQAKDRPVTFRANTLKSSAEEVAEALHAAGIEFKRVPWYADAFIVPASFERAVWDLDLIHDGKIYLQSLSSLLPPLALAMQAGQDILDMCAAPGGKTTQIAALEPQAHVTAAEMHAPRADKLEHNLEKRCCRERTMRGS